MVDGERVLGEYIGASDSLLQELMDHAQLLSHQGKDAQIHAISLYASAMELFSSCIVLAKAGECTAIPVLLRPMYEALVDLDNLLREPRYVERLEAANLKQILKLLSAAAKGNPLMEGFTDDTPATSQAFAARLSELKAAGMGPLQIEDRCRRVGRLDEYETFYALFCLDSHNNSAALADRHIADQASGVPLISFFQKPNPCIVARRLEMGMWILVQAARMVHATFRVASEQIEVLVGRYQCERAARSNALGR